VCVVEFTLGIVGCVRKRYAACSVLFDRSGQQLDPSSLPAASGHHDRFGLEPVASDLDRTVVINSFCVLVPQVDPRRDTALVDDLDLLVRRRKNANPRVQNARLPRRNSN
jgi:hypothetical protein